MDEVTTHYGDRSPSLKGVLSLNCGSEDIDILGQPSSRQGCERQDYPSSNNVLSDRAIAVDQGRNEK
jgi:hypothetical protein